MGMGGTDQLQVALILGRFLLENNFRVTTASDVKDARAAMRGLEFDLILLDVMMPEYDGFYALENIKQINPEAKVIMVTADLTADTEKKLKSLNASAVIYKPYEIDSVIDTIHDVSKQAVTIPQ